MAAGAVVIDRYPPLAHNTTMERRFHTVVETDAYLRSAERLMSDEEREAVVTLFAIDPQAGAVIPGTGGLRKARIPLTGRGKRGGARVITYYLAERAVYLLLAYAKNEQSDLTPDQARTLCRSIESLSEDDG